LKAHPIRFHREGLGDRGKGLDVVSFLLSNLKNRKKEALFYISPAEIPFTARIQNLK
jgi:hypothetical protein